MFGLKRKEKPIVTTKAEARYVVKVTRNSNRAAKRGLWGEKIIKGVKTWVNCWSKTYIKDPKGEPARTSDFNPRQTSKYVRHVGIKQIRKHKAKLAKSHAAFS